MLHDCSSLNNPILGGVLAYLSSLLAQEFIVQTSPCLSQFVQSGHTHWQHVQWLAVIVDVAELQEGM